MTKYIGFGFLASALASVFMFIRALINGFSNDVGLCITNGGESCFATSNPVWTASTLAWLSPVIFVISVLGLLIVGVLGENFFSYILGFGIFLGIIALALGNEIKDKSGWMAPVFNNTIKMLFS